MRVQRQPRMTTGFEALWFFKEIRQPDWWQGDALPHPAPEHAPVSNLEKRLSEGKFAITAEIAPPLSAGTEELIKKIIMLIKHGMKNIMS